jgi:5-methylcytosine-specific restriction endonuclease McrA
MKKSPFNNKKLFKLRNKHCQICNEDDYALLDVHRWSLEGKDGGKYCNDNCICVCVTCHRLIHSNKIKIMGKYNSTAGKVLHFIDKNGNEQFK